jgi:hypothetical protein
MQMAGGVRWRVAALAVALLAGEVAAFAGAAPRARTFLERGPGAAALRAGAIVGAKLPALAAAAAARGGAAVIVRMVRQTSQLYRMALLLGGATCDSPRPRVRRVILGVMAGSSSRAAIEAAASRYARRCASSRRPFRITTTVLPSCPETATGSRSAPSGVCCPRNTQQTSSNITPEAIATF